MSIYTNSRQFANFKHLSDLSTIVQATFIISAIVYAVALISGYLQNQLLADIKIGMPVTQAEIIASDNREWSISLAGLIVFVVSAIIFLIWVHRVNKNLHAFDKPQLRFSPGWAVGWWFIPIMNFFRPYQIMSEIWKASKPDLDPDLKDVRGSPTSAIVGWWWASYLISNLISEIAGRLLISGESVDELINANYTYMAAHIVSIAGIFLLILMVKRISQNQEMRYNKLTKPPLQEAS